MRARAGAATHGTHRAARAPRGGPLAGTLPLLRASMRHDGRLLAPWVVIATALSASSVLVYPWLFPDLADRQGLAAAIGSNPAIGLIFGPARDLLTDDGFNAWRSLALGGFLTALGMIFAMVRATRAQEDSGQAELLAAGVLGRSSRLLVGVVMGSIGSLLTGVVSALVTVLCGGHWEPSLLLGATFVATGWMFTAIAAVAAQLGSDARTASSMAVGTLGTLFVLRGLAYSVDAPEWTIWINPLGWMTETQPATENRWWPLLLAVGLAAVGIGVAVLLQARRDFGQGFVSPGPGPARGAVRSSGRLAWRVNRGAILTWTLAMALLGVVFGNFAGSITDILEGEGAVQKIVASGAATQDQLVSGFLVMILSLIGIIAAVPGVQILLKLHSEELEDRVEPVLATAVGRPRFYGAHVLLALGTTAVHVLLSGTILAVLAAAADIGVDLGDIVLQAAVTIPAVWAVVAVSVAVVGARPQVSIAAWAGVLVSFGLTLLGPTFDLPDWALAISPFWHVPDVTDADPALTGLLGVGLVALVLLVIGFVGFRRRDLAR